MNRILMVTASLAIFAALLLSGCNRSAGPSTKAEKTGKAKSERKESHEHGAGPHGGAVGDWGGGKYHIEFTVDHDKKEATVYILGSDETTPVPIKAKDGQLLLNIKGLKNNDEYKVPLKAEPQKDDPEGKSSRFVGKDAKLGVEQEYAGTVSGEADGVPYTGDFKEEPEAGSTKKSGP
jgi:hypothetical protein